MSSNGWKTFTLNEVATIVDSLHKTPNYTTTGYPMVRAADIKAGFLKLDNALRVSENDFIEFTKKHQPKRGDIVFSRVGSYFVTSYVATDEKFCMGQNTIVLAPKINSKYLFYYLNSQEVTNQIEQLAAGTSQRTIGIGSIKTIKITVPCIELQEKIASILSSLDDKIELNQQTNHTLEAIAQALFKEWFVDFNFPGATGEMKESELGEIPQGWEVKKLGDIAELIKGVSYRSSELMPSRFALVTLKSINRGGGLNFNGFKEFNGKYKPTQELHQGDVIFAQTDITQNADVIGCPAIVENPFNYERLIASVDIVKCKPKGQLVSHEFLYSLLSLQSFKDYCLSHTNGSTVLHLRSGEVINFQFILPNENLLKTYTKTVQSIRDRIRLFNQETQTLIQLRDTLLPKLMNGEITITETEKQIASVI
jgi:type I restriction enzyme S subunit